MKQQGTKQDYMYSDKYINNLNQQLQADDKRKCKVCGEIKHISSFPLRYYQVTKETKGLPKAQQKKMPVYWSTCGECIEDIEYGGR